MEQEVEVAVDMAVQVEAVAAVEEEDEAHMEQEVEVTVDVAVQVEAAVEEDKVANTGFGF